jgi:hypothetical protein
MWYRLASSLKDIDEVAEIVANMHPYDTTKHFDLLTSQMNKEKLQPGEDVLDKLQEWGRFSKNYLSIHPQIYAYPKESENQWRYLLYDPKHLRRLDNPEYYEDLSTRIPLSESISVYNVLNWLHSKYPTALIDYYETEEEMLRDA